MEMEGMLARIVVVEDDFDDLVVFKDEGIGVDSVNGWI